VPTYDYVCTSCGHRMEVVHSVHGHGPTECPKCGAPMKKAFTPPTFHFKGSGWARKERGSSSTSRSASKAADSGGSGGSGDSHGSGGTGDSGGSHDSGHSHGSGTSGSSSDERAKPAPSSAPAPKDAD
jgi:putative FmdB family regulatory protein